jgi:hypothetical protein
MAIWKRQEDDIISCECGETLILKKEKLPRGYYYAPKKAECPECETHYERSPTGHLYLSHDPTGRYDSMRCVEDMGGLERVVRSFKTLFGRDRWEIVVYCPRHEESPANFLKGVFDVPEPFDTEGAMIMFTSLVMDAQYRRDMKKTGQESDSEPSE